MENRHISKLAQTVVNFIQVHIKQMADSSIAGQVVIGAVPDPIDYLRNGIFPQVRSRRRTGGNSNPNSYTVQRENSIFFKFAQQSVLLPEWEPLKRL